MWPVLGWCAPCLNGSFLFEIDGKGGVDRRDTFVRRISLCVYFPERNTFIRRVFLRWVARSLHRSWECRFLRSLMRSLCFCAFVPSCLWAFALCATRLRRFLLDRTCLYLVLSFLPPSFMLLAMLLKSLCKFPLWVSPVGGMTLHFWTR